MRRTLAIVVAAVIVGGIAGASIGLAFDNGGSASDEQRLSLSRERAQRSTRRRFIRALPLVSS